MSLRKLLIAAGLLAVLAGGVWWSNKHQAAEEARPKKEDAATPKILTVTDDQVAGLALKRKDADAVVLKRTPANKWEMTEPKPYRVDGDVVAGVIGALNPLTSTQIVDEKPANLAPFGLDAPAFELAVTTKDGKTRKLLVGDDAPAGGDTYVKLDGDARVYTIASSTKGTLDKSAQDLRDKRLLSFDYEKLTRLELSAKTDRIEFGKNNQNEWRILAPRPLRADGWQVEEVIRKLRDAKMDATSAEDDGKQATAAFGSAKPIATAKVTDNTGTQTIEVRKGKDDYYARSSVVNGAYKVPNDLGQGLDKGLDDFRNKKLFDFGFVDPSKVEVTREGKTAAYAKTGEKWFSGTKELDPATVQGFIDKLRDLAAAKFSEATPGAPAMQVTVTAKDGKLVDKVVIAQQGGSYLGKREGEADIYEIDAKVAQELITAFTGVKEVSSAAAKK
jgi:hypothetical protein